MIKKVFLLMILIIVLILSGNKFGFFGNQSLHKFENLQDAERKIGKIKTPDLPGNFKITKVEYYDDGFTAPSTTVHYIDNNKKEIIFMTCYSAYAHNGQEEIIKNWKSMSWIKESEKYTLRWRSYKEEPYKYLISTDENDKQVFIDIAERY